VVVHVDERNEIARVDSHPEVLLDDKLASHAGLSKPAGSGRVAEHAGGVGDVR
jgi:hypothetical protein